MTIALTVPAPTAPPHAAASAEPERQVPYPLRFWWLKRLTLLCVLLAAALAAVRLGSGWHADRRLRAALDPVVAEGGPVRPADLNPPAVPDEVNSAAYLKQAMAAIDMLNDSPAASSSGAPFYSAEWESLSEKSVAGSAKVFPLARQARAFRQVDWGTRVKRPPISVTLPYLNQARHMANTVGDAALYAHANGDDAAAVEAIRDVRHLAKAVGHDPFIICHLVEVGIESLALQRLQMIAAGLQVAPEDATAPQPPVPFPTTKANTPRRPATRAQVRVLIAELLDERDVDASLKRALAGERVAHLDTADWMAESSRVLRPMYQLDTVRMLEQDEVLMEAAAQPTWPEVRGVLARRLAGKPPPPAPPAPAAPGTSAKRQPVDYARVLSSTLLGGGIMNGRFFEISLRARAERRMTAASLAAQLYRADHGEWPPSLQALVPNYLPAVPADSLAVPGTPLKYMLVKGGIPGGADRPVVYSVGRDGDDDTPDATALPGAPWAGWHNGRDEYRDITHWVVPAPGTQPATAPAAGGKP